MAEKEYIVSLAKGVDYDQFNQDMIASTGAGDIPNRAVDVANARPGSQRNTHYSLTDDEAAALRNDPRVIGVEIPPEQRDDIEIGLNAIQSGSWEKSTTAGSSSDLPWGLLRGAIREDAWNQATSITRDLPYTLSGKHVDVVIQDSGLQVDHPEFTDANGNSRVQQIDWYEKSGLPGTQSVNHYRDWHGHGSHCAGTVAGRTMGWAKNANIYSVKVAGLEGSGDSGTGISISDCFDVIKLWHRNKPINPETGVKNPTVVNASWGYGGTRSSSVCSSGNYRGTSWTSSDADYLNTTLQHRNAGIIPPLGFSKRINVRVSSVDVDLQECIDEGIIFCIAAGNSYYYIAADGDQDWNNYANFGLGNEYYMRGSSPYDTEAFIVGNIDITYASNLEHKAESSCCGAGVDIYAPGTEIISVGSTDNNGTSDLYSSYGGPNSPLDSNYKLMKISGTSMASPNVAGMIACILEANPKMTPAAMKNYIHNNAGQDLLYDAPGAPQANTWDNQVAIQGGPNRIFHSPLFASDKPVQYKGGIIRS